MLRSLFQRSTASGAQKGASDEKRPPRDRRNFGRTGSLHQLRPRPSPPSPEPGRPARAKSSRDARGGAARRTRERPPAQPAPPTPPAAAEAEDVFATVEPEPCADPIVLPVDRLDKLLHTLTTREGQLTKRIDRAHEALVAAQRALHDCPSGSPGHDGARRRVLAAAREKRTLKNSLAVTTQQSDCVLRALGRCGLVSIDEHVQNRVVESRAELEEATAHAERTVEAFKASFGGDVGPEEEEQIAREVEEHLHTPPQLSVDWVAEARRKESESMKELENVKRPPRERRLERSDRAQDHIDPRVQFGQVEVEGMGNGVPKKHRQKQGENGEPRVSVEAGRMSIDRIRAKIPKGASFTRRKRGEKRR